MKPRSRKGAEVLVALQCVITSRSHADVSGTPMWYLQPRNREMLISVPMQKQRQRHADAVPAGEEGRDS